jgi:hypothetical protein
MIKMNQIPNELRQSISRVLWIYTHRRQVIEDSITTSTPLRVVETTMPHAMGRMPMY